jgi:hypothetical protein
LGFLRSVAARTGGSAPEARELVLLTFVHSGVRQGDPLFDEMLRAMLSENLGTTYRTALEAMVLEELDRVTYQRRIFQCAQFLVDNLCPNGQWSYGQPTTYPEPTIKDLATGGSNGGSHVVIFGDPEPGQKPAVLQKIPVRKQREGPPRGDNSNSQYALLGLRACHDAGIVLPREVIQKAADWWRASQCTGSPVPPSKKEGVPTGGPGAVEPRGWSYLLRGDAYGSMTAGAVGALTICDFILGSDWKKDDAVNAGLNWLRDNFTVSENPRHGQNHHYYYLYGLERAGMLTGTEKLGKNDWYAEGTSYLLEAQARDGGWGSSIDTCFAILFLRRATRSLTETRDLQRKK